MLLNCHIQKSPADDVKVKFMLTAVSKDRFSCWNCCLQCLGQFLLERDLSGFTDHALLRYFLFVYLILNRTI